MLRAGYQLFEVIDFFAISMGVVDFGLSARTDVSPDVDDIDSISHVNLAFVHIVQHLFDAFGPNFIVAAVTEEAYADDDISFQGQAPLGFKELFFEAGAATEGNDWIIPDHIMLLYNARDRRLSRILAQILLANNDSS